MSKARVLLLVVAVFVALLVAAAPAHGGAASAGGPWSYVRGGITAQFSGSHNAANGSAYGQTNDFNGLCAALRVRLKYNPGNIDTGWRESASTTAIFQVLAPAGTTAVSSQHRAQHNWDLTWSGIQQPHAW